MTQIIEKVLSSLRSDLEEFFGREEASLDTAEEFFSQKICTAVIELMRGFYEKLDIELLEDKKGRRASGLRVERKNCKREVLTKFGVLEYNRTYYKKTADGSYVYPIDAVVGIESYQRLSSGVSQELVAVATRASYAKSSMSLRVDVFPEGRYAIKCARQHQLSLS